MLASQDPQTNANDIPMTSRPQQTRSSQDTNYQIDDNSRPSAVIAASPQYIDGYSTHATYTDDSSSSCGTPLTLLHSQIQLSELSSPSVSNNPHAYSPSLLSNPQTYSPAFTSPTTPASTYISPPSSTPSQKYAYSSPERLQNYPQGDGTSQQHQYMHHHQDPYQDPYQHIYQQQQQQGYPEPVAHTYLEPALIDVNDKAHQSSLMIDPTATSLAASQRRKKFIWIGVIITFLAFGVTLGLVFGLKDNNNNKDSGNSNTGIPGGIQGFPTNFPTGFPTNFPTGFPTNFPTAFPSNFPTAWPSGFPTAWPAGFPIPTGFPNK